MVLCEVLKECITSAGPKKPGDKVEMSEQEVLLLTAGYNNPCVREVEKQSKPAKVQKQEPPPVETQKEPPLTERKAEPAAVKEPAKSPARESTKKKKKK